jgi:hypothetical protein
VYAAVTDAGNPPSGISSVKANVGTITAGQTSALLSSGSFTVAGQSFTHQGGALTAAASLSSGTYTYSLTSTDAAGRARTQSGYSVIVDNTAPAATDVSTANRTGNIAGRPEAGDTATLTYGELVDPNSIVAGWGGASTNVVVHIDNKVAAYGGNDVLTVWNAANTAQLPFGAVSLGRNDYVGGNKTFGATGTPSTVIASGNAFVVTLGTSSGSTTTGAGTGTMVWYPAAGATDRAGNPASTAALTEPGAADKEF